MAKPLSKRSGFYSHLRMRCTEWKMGHPPQQSASLPLTWESIWGKMFTLRCEKRGRQKSHRKSVVGNGQEMGFSLLVLMGLARGVMRRRLPQECFPPFSASLRDPACDRVERVAWPTNPLWAPLKQGAEPGPAPPPRLLFLSHWSLSGSETSEGRLSFPGLEASRGHCTSRPMTCQHPRRDRSHIH